MKRGNFLKSLFTLIAAPSVISKIDIAEPVARVYPLTVSEATQSLLSKKYISAINFLDQRDINFIPADYDDIISIMDRCKPE